MNQPSESNDGFLEPLMVWGLKAVLTAAWLYSVYRLAVRFMDTEHSRVETVIIVVAMLMSLGALAVVLVGPSVFRGLVVFGCMTKAATTPLWGALGYEVDRDGAVWLGLCGILTLLLAIADHKPTADSEGDRDRDQRGR